MLKGFSVIVCTYNGKNRLKSTLLSISKLQSKLDFEFLLIDNASTDGTSNWVLEFWKKNNISIPIRVFEEKKAGLMNARIRGIQEAKYEFLLFCDDDNELAFDYLDIAQDIFHNFPKVGVIGGMGEIPISLSIPEWFSFYQKSFAIGPQQSESGMLYQKPSHIYGAGAFFRRKPLSNLIEAGYQFFLSGRTQEQTISGDDLELCWLMQLVGYQIYYSNELKFIHHIDLERLNTNYLIQMKTGTSLGSALLFAYRSYFQNQKRSIESFKKEYLIQWVKIGSVLLKNRIKYFYQNKTWNSELALSILNSRFISFSTFRKQSVLIYSQLQNFEEYWNLD